MVLSPYFWLLLAGIAVSFWFWLRLARRDRRLLIIYAAALAGAFAGAKVVYFFAEGYTHLGASDMWLQLATGKSILGGLLGGFLAVELAKRWIGYSGITGDWFAVIAPIGIIMGRIGCWMHGCCRGIECAPAWFTTTDAAGVTRWPAVPIEIIFNLLFLATVVLLRRGRLLPGQHFHLYLIAYGAFRFFHEYLREEPRLFGPFTGYQIASLVVLALGALAFAHRKRLQDEYNLIPSSTF
ncbi:MAG: diacylglyceryl transferase [Verrucomicrobia bacterium]|nr:MAG: diacylglyceryl transferase [Verrucomicrobiota bacterium]